MKQFTLAIAEDIANRQRGKWGLSEASPINAKTLLRQLNILTLYRPLSEKSSGLSIKANDNKYFMLINSNANRGRQHYTIAHELYHLFVDDNPTPHFCNEDKEKDTNERNADLFASCLLMPRSGVLKNIPIDELKNRSITMGTILHLEQLFSVSHQAMVYRLKKMKLIDEKQLQVFLGVNIKNTASLYGMDLSLYEPGNKGVIIGDYGTKARTLFESDKISEGHYNELMNSIYYDKD